MSEQLSMLDTMFLELEQADDAAHMHIGGVCIFESDDSCCGAVRISRST